MLEVSTIREGDPYLKFDAGESFDNNSVYEAYEKDIGVKITNQWVAADANQYKEKLKIAIASNDIPDLMLVDATQLQQLIEADMIMDLTAVYDKASTPETKKFMKMDGGIQMKSATFGGKLMAIPRTSNPFYAQFLYVRTDWLKKLSLPEPKTMQDLMTGCWFPGILVGIAHDQSQAVTARHRGEIGGTWQSGGAIGAAKRVFGG
ncbi:extracellular solute-binding protein [Paenibacillus sp. Root444D2]|uniref:extracellular solute-binding protein n=1 Tax=Paenibacillus sp. Root444D2 TaxID=1736538 RepID=UPI00070911C1|nr:extracellular solute-binding protein [Paenibacillus sp. Root444D2]KQX68200.1 hypothetical protein ASD40_25320 [Paenibacillus sp. Root444D2]